MSASDCTARASSTASTAVERPAWLCAAAAAATGQKHTVFLSTHARAPSQSTPTAPRERGRRRRVSEEQHGRGAYDKTTSRSGKESNEDISGREGILTRNRQFRPKICLRPCPSPTGRLLYIPRTQTFAATDRRILAVERSTFEGVARCRCAAQGGV